MQSANVTAMHPSVKEARSFFGCKQITHTAQKKNAVQTAAYGLSRETAL